MYGVIADSFIPFFAFRNVVPLFLSAIIIDARKAGAVRKRPTVNFCYAIRNSNTCKIGATVKCHIADMRYTVRNGDAQKSGAIRKCTHFDFCNTSVIRNYAVFATGN